MKRPDPDRVPCNDNSVPEDDLQAYVDGQLDGRRRAAIEAFLATHPGEAERLAAYRAQNIGLHALFDPPVRSGRGDSLPPDIAALAAAIDARLEDAGQSETASGPAAPRGRRLRRLAASIVLLLAAGAAGWVALEADGWPGRSLVAFTREAPQTQSPLPPLPAAAVVNSDTRTEDTAKTSGDRKSVTPEAAAVASPTPPASAGGATDGAAPAKTPAAPTLESIDPAIERSPVAPAPPPAAEAAKET